jgi:N-acetylmuramoyl-L-alanine amidase
VSLVERGKRSKGADLFLSLHSNAASTAAPDCVLGICQVQNERSRLIATVLAEAAADAMGLTYQITTKSSDKDRDGDGHKDDYYGVLRGAAQVGTTGVILEHGFHTNEANTRWLMEQSNLEKLADAEAKAIALWLGIGEKEVDISLPVVKKGAKSQTVRAL